MNKVIWIVGVLGVIAVLLLIFKPATELTPVNETTTVEEPKVQTGITYGDLVSINFVLTLENGSVVDTNNEELAKKYGIKDYVKGPFKFIMGQSSKVPGFDDALLGMNKGEHRETFIEPSEPEVIFQVNRTNILDRFITIPRRQKFPITTFEQTFGKPAIVGDVVVHKNLAFKYQIKNMTEKYVIGYMLLKEGEEYNLPNTRWPSVVRKIAEEDAMFYQIPEENQTVEAPFGTARVELTGSRIMLRLDPVLNKIFNKTMEVGGGFSLPQRFQVIEVKEDSFTIKRYGELTDKRLKFVVDLLEVTEDVKEIRQDKPRITEIVGGTQN